MNLPRNWFTLLQIALVAGVSFIMMFNLSKRLK